MATFRGIRPYQRAWTTTGAHGEPEGCRTRRGVHAVHGAGGPSLLRTAWLLTGDAHDAQELTQAALVKTYVAGGRVRDGEGLAYARRVLVNHRTDRWRATRLEHTTDAVPGGHTPFVAASADPDVKGTITVTGGGESQTLTTWDVPPPS